MKTSSVFLSLLHKLIVLLVVLLAYAIWVALLSILLVPTAVYVVIVTPIGWALGLKKNIHRPVDWVADLLFDEIFSWVEKITYK